ncbi:MAG: 30S ribosomal protein S20 [Patescibacteria group bacterium]
MAHKHAAIKHLRQTKKRTAQNTNVKKSLTYLRKAALKAIEKKDQKEALRLYGEFQKAADRAAGKNIIKKNTAARKKSRILTKVNALKA